MGLLASLRHFPRRLAHRTSGIWVLIFIPMCIIGVVTLSPPSVPELPSLRLQTVLEPQPELPKVHLFMPINEKVARKSPRFCKALLGSMMTGYSPIIYNWDKSMSVMGMHKAKVTGLNHILETQEDLMGDDDLILVLDALDVWLQLPPNVLASRYLQYGDLPLVGAEKHCIPNPWDSEACQNAPPSPLPDDLSWETERIGKLDKAYSFHPSHANSGTLVGRLGKVRPLIANLAAIIADPEYPFPGDQGAFNIKLAEGELGVDHHFRLFWASAADEHSLTWLNTPLNPDTHILSASVPFNSVTGTPPVDPSDPVPWNNYPTLGHHRLTGQIPVALHYNAMKSKDLMGKLWGMPWYSSKRFSDVVRQKMDGSTFRVLLQDGQMIELSYMEICGTLFDGEMEDR